jgi:hypothetical protein
MAFPSKFKPGGKKGPRQATSKRQPHIKMKPAPARSHVAGEGDEELAAEEAAWAGYDGSDNEEEEGEEAYGYREALQGESKPLEGLRVSVSGCGGKKEDLLALAAEYGAERHGGLQEDTTHLVADKPEGLKYQVRFSFLSLPFSPNVLTALCRSHWLVG